MTVSVGSPDIVAHRLMDRALAALDDFNNGRDAQFLAALPGLLQNTRFLPAAEDADARTYTPNAFHSLLLQMFSALSHIFLEDVYQDHIHIFTPSVLYQVMRLLHLLLPRAKENVDNISSILEPVVAALSLLLANPTGMQIFMEGPSIPRCRLNYFHIFLDYIVLFSSSEGTTSVVSHIQNVLALITAPRNEHADPFWDYFATVDNHAVGVPLLRDLGRMCDLATELRLDPDCTDIPEYFLTNVLCVGLLGSRNLDNHAVILQCGLVPSLVLFLDRTVKAGELKPAVWILAQLYSIFLIEDSDAFGTALPEALKSGLVITLSRAVDLLGDNMDLQWVEEIFAMISDTVRCRPSMASIVRGELLDALKVGLGKGSLPLAWQLLVDVVYDYTDEIDDEVVVRCGNYPRCRKPFAADRFYHYCPFCQRFLTCSKTCFESACDHGAHDSETCQGVERHHD